MVSKSRNVEEEILGMLTVAQDQQVLVQQALTRLEAQEAAVEQQRQTLDTTAATLREETARLGTIAEAMGPLLSNSTDKTVRTAVANGLAGAGHTAATAMVATAEPLVTRLTAVVASAEAIEPSLRRAAGWATWRLMARLGTLAMVLVALLVGTRAGLEWWWRYELAMTQAQVSALQMEIAGLKDTRDLLRQAGGKAGLTKCGPSARLCVRVDEAAGSFGDPADYRVIRGY